MRITPGQMAASLKRKVKVMTSTSRKSEFLFERRGLRSASYIFILTGEDIRHAARMRRSDLS